MVADFRIVGYKDLERLGKDLKAAGDKELKKELLKGIQRATRDSGIKQEIADSARAHLPQRGGLSEYVAKMRIITRTRTNGKYIGVRLTGSKKKGAKQVDLYRIDRGTVRHPTYGHRPWVNQGVRPGFWTEPLEGPIAFEVKQQILRVIADIARKLESRRAA